LTQPAGAFVPLLLLTALMGAGSVLAHHAVAHDILVIAAPRILLHPTAGDTVQVHLSLRNRSRHDHALIGAESPVAGEARIIAGTSSPSSGSGGVESQGGISVPARGTLHLVPGGPHILLTNVTADLRPGHAVAVTLRFQDQSALKLIAEVAGP
jgi:copper(I)-binding protein